MQDKFLNPVRKAELSGQDNVFGNNEKEIQHGQSFLEISKKEISKNRLSNGVKLTNTVYKVLEFFPESDPLKNRAKDRVLSIMEYLTLIDKGSNDSVIKTHISEDIDVLLGYLWIGKSQGWLNSSNCLIISNEYEKITLQLRSGQEKEIEPAIPDKSPAVAGQFDGPAIISPMASLGGEQLGTRQKKILEFLGKNEKAQVMDLRAILSDVTKRTIRRDLDELLEAGKIVRLGEFNQVFYKTK